MAAELICDAGICIDLKFPLYAIAIMGSFLMIVVNRLEIENGVRENYRMGYCLMYAELLLVSAILFAVGDIFLIHLMGMSIGKASVIAGFSITFVAVSVMIIFGTRVYKPLMGTIKSVQHVMKI